ncbi:MAG TPA: glutamate-1-semialdehyde 2,1-aminomutase [Chthonomonadaceae bacterium]|nr:glutamate-1-semialdehyde 2,1-aminomutase [Chthonomonadaceae bacterium]
MSMVSPRSHGMVGLAHTPPTDGPRYARSEALYERACNVIPGGISSNVRKNWSPVPLFYARGEGSRVWDEDGNEYIDYVLARGPLLLGHSPRLVLDAVKAQLENGLMYAGQTRLEVEAAERICELVPCAEMVRFSNSGSEAVHAAWRLARGVTGKPKIVRFEGHYHGWFDSQIWSAAPPVEAAGPPEAPIAVPGSGGVPASEGENLIVLPWNDPDLLRKTLETRGHEIALVCTEPVMCNNGALPPRPGYLETMRELCTRHGVLLMFDEVITGFRLSLGGAQQFFGVTPDLATFAKGIAAGFTVSALAGRREIMERFGDLSILHAGTYNANPPCMAAVLAALDVLSADDGAVYRTLAARGQRLIEGIREAGARHKKPVAVHGFPPAFTVSFGHEGPVTDYRSYARRDRAMQRRYFELLQERGIRTTPDQLSFVSAAHTEADIEQTLEAVNEVMQLL